MGKIKLDARVRVEDCFEFDFDKHRKKGKKQVSEGLAVWKKAISGEWLWVVEFVITERELQLYVEDPEGRLHVDEFAIENIETPVGGLRPYLICPDCESRVLKVYAKYIGGQFRCRHCHDLVYSQQMEQTPLQHELSKLSLQELLDRMKETSKADELVELVNAVNNYVVADTRPWYEVLA